MRPDLWLPWYKKIVVELDRRIVPIVPGVASLMVVCKSGEPVTLHIDMIEREIDIPIATYALGVYARIVVGFDMPDLREWVEEPDKRETEPKCEACGGPVIQNRDDLWTFICLACGAESKLASAGRGEEQPS